MVTLTRVQCAPASSPSSTTSIPLPLDLSSLLQVFLFSLPGALLVLTFDALFFDLPLYAELGACLLVSLGLRNMRYFASYAACVVTLCTGTTMINVKPTVSSSSSLTSQQYILYEAYDEPQSIVLRQALSMLGMDVVVRSVPRQMKQQQRKVSSLDDGDSASSPTNAASTADSLLDTPWRDELIHHLRSDNHPSSRDPSLPLPLPYLFASGVSDISIPASLQGHGFLLGKHLIDTYALDAKDAFPYDTDAKLLDILSLIASYLRGLYATYGSAIQLDWGKLNRVREEWNWRRHGEPIATATSPSIIATTTADDQQQQHERNASLLVDSLLDAEISKVNNRVSPSNSVSSVSVSLLALPSPANGNNNASRLTPTSTNSQSTAATVTPAPTSSPAFSFSPIQSPASTSTSPSTTNNNEPSSAALKLRAQLLRQANARASGSANNNNNSNSVLSFHDIDSNDEFQPVSSYTDLHPLLIYSHESHTGETVTMFQLLFSLQLQYHLMTCAHGSAHRARAILEWTGKDGSASRKFHLPIVYDPNTRQSLVGGQETVRYLKSVYVREEDL